MRGTAVSGAGEAGAGVVGGRRSRSAAALTLSIVMALPLVAAAPAVADERAEVVDEHSSDTALIASMATAPRDTKGRVRVIVKLDVDDEVAGLGGWLRDAEAVREDRARATARATEQVTDTLETLDLDVEVARTFAHAPYLALATEPSALPTLNALPGVAGVVPDDRTTTMLDRSVPMIGAADPTPSYAGAGLDGAGQTIAVIDTGVDVGHPLLAPLVSDERLVAEACFSSTGDCPNGETTMTGTGAGAPLHGSDHGTHVAGIAVGASGAGVVDQGVAPGAELIAVQAFSVLSDGGRTSYVSDLIESLSFVLGQHQADNGIDVAAVNLSLGTGPQTTCEATGSWELFADEVSALRAAGVVTIAAAGNQRSRDAMSLPACLPEVVGVGATDDVGDVASFSNISEDTDLVAPGVAILSSSLDLDYSYKSGTSMAAPHVAGAAALLRQAAPWSSVDDLAGALGTSLTSVDDDREAQAIGDDEYPAGSVEGLPLLDLPTATTILPGDAAGPGAPAQLAADPGDGALDVFWEAPSHEGASPISRYDVLARPGAHTCAVTGADPATGCTISGLSNGTSYTITVVASNDDGPGPSSSPLDAAIPATAPAPPTDVIASAGVNEVTVSWKAPSDDGGLPVTRYDVDADPDHGSCSSEGPEPATSCVVTGLTGNQAYTFTVTATNDSSTSAPSDPSDPVTPDAVPDAPTGLQASDGDDGTSTVSWEPPDDPGTSPIIRYRVTSAPDGGTCVTEDPPTTECVVEGLTNGTEYTFSVTATNDSGTGPASVASDPVTPTGVPTAPREVIATSGDGQVMLSWTEPDNDGGLTIDRYLVSTNGATPENCTAGTTCVIGGLTNGTAYTFTVQAENSKGSGPPSAPTPETIPSTVPDPPTDVTVTAGDPDTAVVSWTAPADDGGATILSYTVTSDPDGRTCDTDGETTTCTVTGLTGGTSYTFTVVAHNSQGGSAASQASAPFTPEASGGSGGGGAGGGGGAPPPPPPEDEGDEDEGDPEPVTDDSGEPPSLSPGTSQLLIGGTSTNTTVTSTSTSLTISNGSFSATLGASTSSGSSSTLSGTSLQLPSGGTLNLDVQGLEGGSSLHGWLFSDPVSLGSVTASSSGAVTGSLDLPDDVPAGSHTLQLSGVLDDGEVVALNLGVEVVGETSFPDVDPTSTHGAAILRLAELGIVTGFADGTYGPGELVTRGQMAAFLQRALGLEDGPSGAFPDVGGTTHDRAIGAIAEAQIAGGFLDGTYRPGDEVTRGQMATFLANAAELDERDDGPFIDVEGTVHADRINAVAHAQIAQGYDDGTFRPGDDITRAQMASFISRMLDHLEVPA